MCRSWPFPARAIDAPLPFRSRFPSQGAVLELRWSPHPPCALHSLSSDGALLQWGPWANPGALIHGGGGSGKGGKPGAGGPGPARQQQHQQQQQQQHQYPSLQPADFGAALRAAAAAAGLGGSGTHALGVGLGQLSGSGSGSCLGPISAIDISSAGSVGSVGSVDSMGSVAEVLVAAGSTDGWVSLFGGPAGSAPLEAAAGAAGAAAVAGLWARPPPLQLLWVARAPQASPASHVVLCPSAPGLLASAHENGTVAVHSTGLSLGGGSSAAPALPAGPPACAQLGGPATALAWHPTEPQQLACALDDSTIQVRGRGRGTGAQQPGGRMACAL